MTETSTLVKVKESERTDANSLLNCIAQVLEEIILETDKLDSQHTIFHASKIPQISIENYLIRI